MQFKQRDQWNWKQFVICYGVAMGIMGFSYPASIIDTTLAQPPFYTYMHLVDAEGLECSGKGEEGQCGSDEDAEVQVD